MQILVAVFLWLAAAVGQAFAHHTPEMLSMTEIEFDSTTMRIVFECTPPATRTDGTCLPASEITAYKWYITYPENTIMAPNQFFTQTSECRFALPIPLNSSTSAQLYRLRVKAVAGGQESDFSNAKDVRTTPQFSP